MKGERGGKCNLLSRQRGVKEIKSRRASWEPVALNGSMRRYLGAVHNLDCRPAFGLNSASRSWNRDSYSGFLEKRAGDAEEDKTVQRFSTDGSSCTHTDVRTCVERRFETDLRPGRRRGEEGGRLPPMNTEKSIGSERRRLLLAAGGGLWQSLEWLNARFIPIHVQHASFNFAPPEHSRDSRIRTRGCRAKKTALCARKSFCAVFFER